jgi:hypothetical protein
MRIIGKIENNQNRGQTPIGSETYFVVTGNSPEQNINISAGSGGLAVMLNPETNVGYYFEILALTENNIGSYSKSAENLHNVIFYKVMRDSGTSKAIPVKLWGGLKNIIVDDGKFTGQSRMVGEQNPTVYDLAVEYQDLGNIRRFFLYINNRLVASIDDKSPLPIYNNMAMFVRGSARCMFENIYALTNNYTQNTTFALDTPIMSAVDDQEIDALFSPQYGYILKHESQSIIIKSPLLKTNFHYKIIDIKHSTINLRSDGLHILNNDNIYYYTNVKECFYRKQKNKL